MALGVNGTGTKWDLDIDNLNGGIEVGAGGGRNAGSGLTGLTGQWMLVTSTLPVTGGNVGAVKTYLNGTVTNAGTGTHGDQHDEPSHLSPWHFREPQHPVSRRAHR